MARIPRYHIIEDGSTFHLCWQCHNKEWLIKDDWAKQIYYDLLLQYKDRYNVEIHSYCFMSNHIHLTGRVARKEELSECFRVVHSKFACAVNKRLKRRGQVIMDRFKSPRIETEADQLRVIIYNDLNPIRAKMVKRPEKYKWSSYWYYAHGQADPLITPAGAYLEMGGTDAERQARYQSMILDIVAAEEQGRNPSRECFSTACFIGDPQWVISQHQALNAYMAQKRHEARQRHRLRFGET